MDERTASDGTHDGTPRGPAQRQAELDELRERVRLQEELLDAIVDALTALCKHVEGDAPELAAKVRDLMFDRSKRTDEAQPL